MSNSAKLKIIFIQSILVLFCISGVTFSATINVPAEYSSIQEAIDNSNHFDTILVGPGTYYECLNYNGKRVVVKSSDGPLVTTITNNDDSNLVVFDSYESYTTVLEGFTLEGGNIGILCEIAGPTIKNNILANQKSTVPYTGAITLRGAGYNTSGNSPARIINNTILDAGMCGVFNDSKLPPLIVNNIFRGNVLAVFSEGVLGDIDYNCFFTDGVIPDDSGTGNITSHPMVLGDYTLHYLSPCIDAGNPDPIYNDPDGSRNDMGAVPYFETPLHDPTTLRVPGDFANIQDAFDYAKTDDTVLVAEGTYEGTFIFPPYDVVFISESGPSNTILNSTILFLPDIQNHMVISGFTFDGRNARGAINGTGIHPTISDCIFHSCISRSVGYVINVYHGTANINNSIFYNNTGVNSGAAIYIKENNNADSSSITGNIFYNHNCPNGSVINLVEGKNVYIGRNIFYSNLSGTMAINGSNIDIVNNTLSYNYGGILFNGFDSIRCLNNIVSHNHDFGLKTYTPPTAEENITIEYNLVWGNIDADYLNLEPGSNNISADPLLVNIPAGALFPDESSPVIDAGNPDPIYNDPDGSRNDIGARAYQIIPAPAGSTILVPSDFGSIQSAIEAAGFYDTVLVGPGTYVENIDFLGKQICVISSHGPRQTIISSPTNQIAVVTCARLENQRSELNGFTITGGKNGIICQNAAPTIKFNIIRDNFDSAIFLTRPGTSLNGSSIIGISGATIINNSIVNNSNAGISYYSSAAPIIKNNIITSSDFVEIYRFDSELVPQPEISYNNIFSITTLTYGIDDPGEGALSVDPLFEDDYSLSPLSLCINAGDPDSIYNDPDNSRNDMGAVPFEGFASPPHDSLYISSITEKMVRNIKIIVSAKFYQSVKRMQIPLELPESIKDINLITEGYVTDYFNAVGCVVYYQSDLIMINIGSSDGHFLQPGTYDLFELEFTMKNISCTENQIINWDTTATGTVNQQLTFYDQLYIPIYPGFDPKKDSTVILPLIPGDLNYDELVDIDDLVYVVDYMFRGGPPTPEPKSMDIDGNCVFDLNDLMYIVDYQFRGGLEPRCTCLPTN